MPLFNLAWKSSFFWDGRAPTLKKQSLEPIENPIEGLQLNGADQKALGAFLKTLT
jgi:cytochrome c peroxidase